MRRDIRILLVGDDAVGKSSLITSLIKESFVPNIQHVVPEVTIPPEVTPENVTTHIVDSSARPENRNQLEIEIRKANVICVVYAIDNAASYERISTYWLPYIRSLGVNIPVVLVGNKIDLRGEDVTNKFLEEEIVPIMNDFKEVETCVECSAKQPVNVSEVFYFAQKAVLHPTAPLYDSREHELKPACVNALRRIFKLCDKDRDNALNDEELNEFQRKCFHAPLQMQELEGVKEVVKENNPNGVNELGLTEQGFSFLHKLFIQRGRLETTWTVLRRFGYGDDLTLREDFLNPQMEVPNDCFLELSPKGYQFFTELFQSYDKDQDGALNQLELEELFRTADLDPSFIQTFSETTVTNDAGAVTLQGFLAKWSMTTLMDYKLTLFSLAYLGFEGDTTQAIKVTKSRKQDRKKGKTSRNVFLAYVVGAPGSGKTSLLRHFINKPFTERYTMTTKPFCVVNSVDRRGAEKYLVLEEFGANYENEMLQSKKITDLCDLICYVYDSSDANSFEWVMTLMKKHDLSHIPSVYIATKSDLDLVQQRFEVQPDTFCNSISIPRPISVSAKDKVMADLYSTITGAAIDSTQWIPNTGDGRSKEKSERSGMAKYLAIGAASGIILAVAVIGLKYFKRQGHL